VIILDTNVVSEPMKPDGDRGVQAWLDEQIAETLYITSISCGFHSCRPGIPRDAGSEFHGMTGR